MTFVAIGIAVALVAALELWRRSRREPEREPPRSKRTASAPRFAGVEVRIGATACEAARAMVGRRFLVGEAPKLPLAGCTEARCRCSFEKLSDRRSETRRWSDEGVSATVFSATERRHVADRRQD
jgi:hypothetical protein